MAAGRRRGLILQHGKDAPPAILGEWARSRGIDHERPQHLARPPARRPGRVRLDRHAWAPSTRRSPTPPRPGSTLRSTSCAGRWTRDVPVLGLCFGGQALAVAAGGSVGRVGPARGRLDCRSRPATPSSIPPGPWLHYHYDLLVPPAEAAVVARSPAGRRRSSSAARSGFSSTPSRRRSRRPSGRAWTPSASSGSASTPWRSRPRARRPARRATESALRALRRLVGGRRRSPRGRNGYIYPRVAEPEPGSSSD